MPTAFWRSRTQPIDGLLPHGWLTQISSLSRATCGRGPGRLDLLDFDPIQSLERDEFWVALLNQSPLIPAKAGIQRPRTQPIPLRGDERN